MTFNSQEINEIRSEFPIFKQHMNGEPLTYLDTANSAQKPLCVIEKITDLYSNHYANIHRGTYKLSHDISDAYENVRSLVKHFINANSANEIIFTKGATEAINLVAMSYGMAHLKAGDIVLITEMEHHANIVPWHLLKKIKNIDLRVIPILDDGSLDLDVFENLLSDKVKFLSLTHISNSLGTLNPIEWIVKKAKQYHIPVLIDGCQAIMHGQVDVQKLGCDFYVFSSHKLYGPTGAGVLWGRKDLLEQMPPYQGGGDMVVEVTMGRTSFKAPPHRFEAGTPPIISVIGMGRAIQFLESIGIQRIERYETHLFNRLEASLEKAFPNGLIRMGKAPSRKALISFTLEDIHPHDAATFLDQEGIAVRAGQHCAHPVLKHFGLSATLRASLGLYNNEQDIERLIKGLKTIWKFFN